MGIARKMITNMHSQNATLSKADEGFGILGKVESYNEWYMKYMAKMVVMMKNRSKVYININKYSLSWMVM